MPLYLLPRIYHKKTINQSKNSYIKYFYPKPKLVKLERGMHDIILAQNLEQNVFFQKYCTN